MELNRIDIPKEPAYPAYGEYRRARRCMKIKIAVVVGSLLVLTGAAFGGKALYDWYEVLRNPPPPVLFGFMPRPMPPTPPAPPPDGNR